MIRGPSLLARASRRFLYIHRHKIASAAVAFCLCIAARAQACEPAKGESARDIARRLGDRFRVTPSEHFAVISDAPAPAVTGLIRVAEDTQSAVTKFSQMTGNANRGGAGALIVVFFDAWRDYSDYARRGGFVVDPNVPGFFDEATNRCIIFNFENSQVVRTKQDELIKARTATLPGARDVAERDRKLARIAELEAQINRTLETLTAVVIRHEIAHQALFKLGLQRGDDLRRRWLKEGLAMQFETFGGPNPYRLADFRRFDAERPTLRKLVEDATLLGPGAEQPQQAYAAAWGLCYYLIQSRPREFAEYLSAPPAKTNSDESKRFQASFGNFDELEAAWLKFMRELRE